MTLLELRKEALETLKTCGSVSAVDYRIDILNGAFEPWKTLHYGSIEEADTAYAKLERHYYAAYLRKYAVVPF